jgi:sulfite dehydrogenase (quinone) subunit SoeC
MHPAYSVIFFTVSSGTGYGLVTLLSVLGAAGLLPDASHFADVAFGVALAAITFGLLSSTYHLGRPQRSWRAFSQWRSSWLSREGVAAIATYVPAGLLAADAFGVIHLGTTAGMFNLAAAALALATIYCTAMIYRSLATIHQWHNAWTVPNYLILGLAAGAVWMNFLLMAFQAGNVFISLSTALMLAVALLSKARYWAFIDETRHGSSPETATGLGHMGKVNLFEAPHTEDNYLMREMGYRVARAHALKLRRYAKLLGFIVPIVLVVAAVFSGASVGVALTLLAALMATAGIIIERWLFFAEAKHVVTLFYGRETA